ncbi:unnamed protein product [Caenorhabditis nigoni]
MRLPESQSASIQTSRAILDEIPEDSENLKILQKSSKCSSSDREIRKILTLLRILNVVGIFRILLVKADPSIYRILQIHLERLLHSRRLQNFRIPKKLQSLGPAGRRPWTIKPSKLQNLKF